MKVVAIIQARMESTRLPGKVLMPILGQPMLSLLVDRIKKSSYIDEIIVATSTLVEDDPIATLVQTLPSIMLYRGSEQDVLCRFYEAALLVDAGYILRVTGDNPFFHAETADSLIALLIEHNIDYVSNNLERTYPYGIDLEAFTFFALKQAHNQTESHFDREHVTPYMRSNSEFFRQCGLKLETDYSGVRLTVDTISDYHNAVLLFEKFGRDVEFTDIVK